MIPTKQLLPYCLIQSCFQIHKKYFYIGTQYFYIWKYFSLKYLGYAIEL